ncbi:MAG: LacI family transcriptional regulator [Anaerolineae bacterium]|nr:LacI family transcriptional regulator [Anaerolineae bacterium]
MSKLTLEQIAKLSGVSRSTVSRVVNNHVSVRPEVRQRILQVIEETGYHPDPAARSLASQRSGIIGLVIPRSVQFLFTDPYYPRLMQGIAQACNTNHYILSLFLFYTEEEEQRLSPRVTRKQLVDGVIVSALPVNDPLTVQLLENDVPFVMIGRPTTSSGISFVDADNTEGAYRAVSHLARLGRRRIATITGPLDTPVGLDRRQGYLNALNERGYPLDEALIVEGDFTETGGYLAMQRLLPHRPDAVFVASDTMALGALRALRGAGLVVPQDIALVGFDDLPGAAVADPPLTTVRQPIQQLGGQAVTSLIDLLRHGPQPPRQTVLKTQLVIRSSCGEKIPKPLLR